MGPKTAWICRRRDEDGNFGSLTGPVTIPIVRSSLRWLRE